MRQAPWKRLATLASAERGAVLWLPALLLAVAVTLFAMQVAPAGVSLFTRTTSLRIALGPCVTDGATASECASFVGAVRHTLAERGDVSLVDSLRVARRLAAANGTPGSLDALLYAVRPLNPHLALQLELHRSAEGWLGRVEAWDVHDERRTVVVEAAESRPEILGRAVAESLSVALYRPGAALAGTQAGTLELPSSSTAR